MWINIAVLVLLFGPGISPVIRTMLSVPSVVLQNAMACKVFRLMRSGSYRSNTEIFQLEIPQNLGGTSSRDLQIPRGALITLPQASSIEMATRIPDTPEIRGWPPVGMEEVCI